MGEEMSESSSERVVVLPGSLYKNDSTIVTRARGQIQDRNLQVQNFQSQDQALSRRDPLGEGHTSTPPRPSISPRVDHQLRYVQCVCILTPYRRGRSGVPAPGGDVQRSGVLGSKSQFLS